MGKIIIHIPQFIEKRAAERETEEHAAGNKTYKFSLAEIARETGLAYSVVHKWARGIVYTSDHGTMAKWCEYFNCQPGDLYEYVADE